MYIRRYPTRGLYSKIAVMYPYLGCYKAICISSSWAVALHNMVFMKIKNIVAVSIVGFILASCSNLYTKLYAYTNTNSASLA